MNYTLIKFQPIKEVDDYFKRVLLKVCQLYPYYKNDILPITREIQQYRKLLKSKEPSTLNPNNIINSLKRFDEVLTTFYNKEDIARRIYLKQLKIISKLLEEPFKEEEYKDIPFGKLYLINKEKYEQLTPENKDVFFDVYTSNKKVKPVMQILDLWLSLKDKKLRNVIREEINDFKGSLKQDVFKDTQKDIKEYITKTNEQLQKAVRQETKEIVEGGPLDKLRFLTSQTFNIAGKEGKISNELLSNLKKYKELKDKYKPLIGKYENARDDDKFNIRREIEEALYELKPVYEFCKEGIKVLENKINTYDKKYELTKLVERIEELNDDKLNYLYQEFAKHSSLFNKSTRNEYEKIINDKYNKIFKSNIEDVLVKELKNLYKNTNFTTKRPLKNKNDEYTSFINKPWASKIKSIINKLKYEDKDNELFNKYNSDEMKDRIIFEVEDKNREEELRKQQEEEELRKKQEEEALRKAQEEAEAQIKPPPIEYDTEEETNKSAEVIEGEEGGDGVKGFGCIKDINMKTITKILEEINNKYGKEDDNKLDSIIYYNLKQRYPNKNDDKFNEFFIKNLKKFDKKYKYDKYKAYMKDKKYTKKYISSLTKGGFFLSGLLNIGKKLLGLNDEVFKGKGLITSLLSSIGLNDKALKERNICGGGILSNILSFVGLSDDIFEKDELLIKIKPLIDLLKKEKDKNKVDAFLYAICKIEFDDDNEEELRDKYYTLLYNYDNLYRKDLFNKRVKKDFYNNKGGFPVAMLAGLIPGAIQGISSLISSISNAVRGKNDEILKKTDAQLKGGKIMTLQELEQLHNEIKK